MKKKPDTVRPQKTQKQQGNLNSARRQAKPKDDFFRDLYENNNPTTLPKISGSSSTETPQNLNVNANEIKSNPSSNNVSYITDGRNCMIHMWVQKNLKI